MRQDSNPGLLCGNVTAVESRSTDILQYHVLHCGLEAGVSWEVAYMTVCGPHAENNDR